MKPGETCFVKQGVGYPVLDFKFNILLAFNYTMTSAYMHSNGDGDVTGWIYTFMSNYNSTKGIVWFGTN